MERRKCSITAGELEWTPAPEPPSPASPRGSELSWEGDGGEEDNFQSQMDERGIIGLDKTHQEEPVLGLGDDQGPDEDGLGSPPCFEKSFGEEDEWDEEQSCIWDTGTPEPHEGPPLTMQDMSFHLGELLDSECAGEDTNTPSQFEDQSVEGQDSVALLESWTEDEEWPRDAGEGDVSRARQARPQNRTPSQQNVQLDVTEDELPESEWEEFQNSPASQVRPRHSGTRRTYCGTNGLESPEAESMKIDLLDEQTGYLLTPTPSPRRNQPAFQGNPQPFHSVNKAELKLGHTNSSEFEAGLDSLSVQGAPSPRESKHSIQGSPESAEDAFAKAKLREPPFRSSSRSTHLKSQKNRSLKPDPHAGEETEVHYPQAFGDLRGQQKDVHKIFGFTRHSHTSSSSPPPVPHTALQISPLPHLSDMGMEDLVDFTGIQEEKFPEASCTESLPDCSVYHPRPTPSPQRNRDDSQESPQSSAAAPRAAHRKSPSRHSPDRTPKTNKPERRSPDATDRRTSPATNPDVRRGKLTHPSPDFSKVPPRVNFPKNGYKPPKSKRVIQQEGMAPEPPMVFKSPADIVREVLLSGGEDPREPRGPTEDGPHQPLNLTVPEGFRDPQQATALVQQLQEDYKRLLTKYAAAENTIDRLRLEAKVGLYSDPPKPSHSVQSGFMKEGSKVMTLNFPQAQRAEMDAPQETHQRSNSVLDHTAGSPARPSSVDSVLSRQRVLRAIEQLTAALLSQVQRFHVQLDTFEELLRRGQLKAHEQIKGLYDLSQGQEALERAYLAAREEHKFQQQAGVRLPPFDPNRDLEGQIFQSGMRLDELKEWVEQTQQAPPMSEPQPSPHPISLSPRDSSDALPRPQGPVCPVGLGGQMAIRVEVSSVSGASEGEEGDMEEEEEETLPSMLLRPLNQKHQCVEQDFSNLLGHYQSVKELPQVLDRHNWQSTTSRDGAPLPADDGMACSQHWKSDHKQDQSKSSQQRPHLIPEPSPGQRAESQSGSLMELPGSLGEATLERCASYPGIQGASSPSRGSGSRRSGSSSLYSLGDTTGTTTTTLNKRTFKAKGRSVRAPFQDGVLSPETDSGFVGSESSRHTPAVHSPLQQGEKARNTPLEEMVEAESPVTVTDSGRPPSRHPLQRPPSLGQVSQGSVGSAGLAGGALPPAPPERRKGGGGGRRPPPCLSSNSSPQRWARDPLQAWTSSGGSDTHSLSGQEDKEQNDQYYRRPANQQPAQRTGSSLSAPYHHGNHLKAQSSVQLTNQREALQSLQAEVSRLQECLEGVLCVPLSSSSEPASPHSPPAHSTPHRPCKRSSRREERGGEGSRLVEEKKEEEEVKREERRTQRAVLRPRSMSTPRPRPEYDSEHAQSELKQHSLRRTPVSKTTPRGSRTASATTQDSRGRHTSQPLRPSVVAQDAVDARQRRNVGTMCHVCASKHSASPGTAQPAGPERSAGVKWLRGSGSPCCPLCGTSEARHRSAAVQTDRQAEQDPSPSSRQPRLESSARRDTGRVFLAPPPDAVLGSVPVVQCVPVYPSMLYYSSPKLKAAMPMLYVSTETERPSHSKAYRSRERERGRSLSSSLDRAIIAAANMKISSRHMVRTLNTGLHHQRALSQSCLY